jgi:glycosyltransferase involved in cell wall biosynthesis
MLRVRSLLRCLCKDVRFDLIHQLNPVYTGISLALWGSRIPVVLGPYVADWPLDPNAITSSRATLRAVIRQTKKAAALVQQIGASAILLTTEAARQRVVLADHWKAPIHFLPHGIDSDFFSPAAPDSSKAVTEERQVILFYANISARKGIFELLQAFELLTTGFPAAELWVAGDGEQLDAVKDLASRLSGGDRIRFLGRQSREDAVLLMRQADVYCLASHGEPYGMTVVEAMSCGLPVVVTDAGGARYLVDEAGGIRVPVKSPSSLAQAIATLLANPVLRREMGLRNRRRVIEEFSWDRVVDRLEEIYRFTLECERGSQLAGNAPRAQFAETLSNGGEPR